MVSLQQTTNKANKNKKHFKIDEQTLSRLKTLCNTGRLCCRILYRISFVIGPPRENSIILETYEIHTVLMDYCAVHVIDMLILRTGLCPLWTFYELGLDSCLGPGTNNCVV